MALNDLLNKPNKRAQRKIVSSRPQKAVEKEYRSFCISEDTGKLVDRLVNTTKVDQRKFTNNDAIKEAFKLLARQHGVKI